MSRLGKQPIEVPSGVKALVENGFIKVEGPKGKLSFAIPDGITLSLNKQDAKSLIVAARASDDKGHKAKHGMVRTIVSNMVKGAASGYEKRLEVVGVGFKAAVKGKILNLIVGYSHPVDFEIPDGIQVKVENNTMITLTGADKALIGEIAAKIRLVRPPEPYQGKGIKYADEKIRRKAGKAAAGTK